MASKLSTDICLRCRQFLRPTPSKKTIYSQTRAFTANVKLSDVVAAPEIDFDKGLAPISRDNARIVPASASYFTSSPEYTDSLLRLQNLLRKYQTLPQVEGSAVPRVAWKNVEDFRTALSERVASAKYNKIIQVLQRLNRIHPMIVPQEVRDETAYYKRDVQPHLNVRKIKPVDEFGRAYGLGRRKSSSARAWLVEGDGEVLVNGKSLNEAFGRIHDRESAVWPLKATDRIDKYNVWVLVNGGGSTGQAESITMAVARALIVHEPGLKPALRRAGCIRRDPRRVERKKAGRVKARKMPTWVKR